MNIRCGNIDETVRKISEDKEYAAAEKARKSERSEFTKSALKTTSDATEWTGRDIPVVFHILEHESVFSENNPAFTEEKLNEQLRILNDCCWPTEEMMDDVAENFRPDIGFLDVKFHLDLPIIRKPVKKKFYGPQDLSMMGTAPNGSPVYNPAKYLNVYVCNIKPHGQAPEPWFAENWPGQDGIQIKPSAFGIGSHTEPRTNGGKTLAHEIGHFFGLQHIWGTSNIGPDEQPDPDDPDKPIFQHTCGDTDGIEDTPNQWGPNFDPIDDVHIPHRSDPKDACPRDDRGDMYMNFMDAGPDDQLLMFSRGQVVWMQRMLDKYRPNLGV